MDLSVINSLKMKQIEYVIQTQDYQDLLGELSEEIRKEVDTAENEADVVARFDLILFSFMDKVLGLKYYPEKEKPVKTERHVSKGRIDSKIGAFVIEFKHCSSLKSVEEEKEATRQLEGYLNGLYAENGTDYIGLVTDGKKCQFLRMESGNIFFGAFENINSTHLDQIIKDIILLKKVALTPENLVKDFCEPSGSCLSSRMIRCLYKTLKNSSTNRSKMLFSEWKELFRLAHDDKSKQKAIEERRESLESIVDEKLNTTDKEYLALYALQTTYAIIVKIIGYKVISRLGFKKNLVEFNKLATMEHKSLRLQMNSLEEGALFRSMGIGNLLEGDFFSWYSLEDQWEEGIGTLIKEVFAKLTIYEDKAIFENGDNACDLFKDLFMSIIPDKVRHSLGEFYTPPWLADNLVGDALEVLDNITDWKALDPCAGSGTFITVLIKRVLKETEGMPKESRLLSVLSRVKAVDLNPLAVLTARINYFINISPLVSLGDRFEIPVYLGDASNVPQRVKVAGVDCVEYVIRTIKSEISITLPCSCLDNPESFSKVMTEIEQDIKNLDSETICKKLIDLVASNDFNKEIEEKIKDLAEQFVELEKNDWNGIWARIVTNFLTTASMGRFDIVVGNPPWIDWKNLPAGYRENIKKLCISRHLFSGDGITGGINLNVCALISNVAAQNWLKDKGVLAFLMPQALMFQQTYEGFRNFELDGSKKMYFQKFVDWTGAGHPFSPVQQKFLTYILSKNQVDYSQGVPVEIIKKKRGYSLKEYSNVTSYEEVEEIFEKNKCIAGHASATKNFFSYAEDPSELDMFKKVSGISYYRGREGVEFYPQELFLLKYDSFVEIDKEKCLLNNYQNKKSKYKIPEETILLEKTFLHPLVKGVDIERFSLKEPKFLVPFPYDESNKRSPIRIKELTKKSPLLAKHFNRFRGIIEAQTDYNAKIIGEKHNNEFYALARVGEYSFADHYVAFRDNTKWQAVVVSSVITPWGEAKRPQFQNHAVTISQTEDGSYITLDEAHYICAVINSPIAKKYILNSSDSRSFKIRPSIHIPKFLKDNPVHAELSSLSQEAHKYHSDKKKMFAINKRLDELVVKLKK